MAVSNSSNSWSISPVEIQINVLKKATNEFLELKVFFLMDLAARDFLNANIGMPL